MATLTTQLCGWGRYPVHTCELERPDRYRDFHPGAVPAIARGRGRSYGDAALNQNGRVLLSERLNRFLAFDRERGVVRAEAGLTLEELLAVAIPRGWFPAVTPGTRYASLGGCVAADVHGKNHHRDGSFGDHVLGLELILADGNRLPCSPQEHPDAFWATIGGMGLTGLIGEVTLRLAPLESAHVVVQHRPARDLEQMFHLLEEPSFDDHYTVAWVDCLAAGRDLGRGIAMAGHHAAPDELPSALRAIPLEHRPQRRHSLPFDLPGRVLNPWTVRAFNALYYRRQGGKGRFLAGYESFFYPLDGLLHWNRMYGKRGFLQYQCAIPTAEAFQGIKALLERLAASRRPSFLAVLKRFGPQGRGLLSFPTAGYTLALDLPLRDPGVFALLDELDRTVLVHGGRVYLAKDARLSPAAFRAMYPRYPEWLEIKRALDPEGGFSSSLSRRLAMGEEE